MLSTAKGDCESLVPKPLVKQNTASTLANEAGFWDDYEHVESSYDGTSDCEASQRESSYSRKESILMDPMWKFYPKQVQNIMKKKRIDRERLRRSLKPPGKRNYKLLFGNIKHVSSEEVCKASEIFKNVLGDYHKLANAEKKIYKALQEKGLFIDKRDFNIMEVFNSGCSEYSDSEVDESLPASHSKYNIKPIEVEKFESASEENKAERNSAESPVTEDLPAYQNNIFKRQRETPSLDLPSIENFRSPNSPYFEKLSHISKYSHQAQNNFVARNSNRMLFHDYKVEKRPQREFIEHPHKRNFDCHCSSKAPPLLYYPMIEFNPYYASDDDWEDSILSDSEMMRSFSMPTSHHAMEDKLVEPCALERQPFSNLINFSRQTHNYTNPLDKVDLKQAFKVDTGCNIFSQPRFPYRNFAEDSFGLEVDENIEL